MTTLRFTKEQLLEALEARRPWAERLDTKETKAHIKAEQETLRKVKAQCREVLKWTYEDLKKHRYNSIVSAERPTCPKSVATKLEREISYVRLSRQKRYNIGNDVYNRGMFWLLTHDEDAPSEDVCS